MNQNCVALQHASQFLGVSTSVLNLPPDNDPENSNERTGMRRSSRFMFDAPSSASADVTAGMNELLDMHGAMESMNNNDNGILFNNDDPMEDAWNAPDAMDQLPAIDGIQRVIDCGDDLPVGGNLPEEEEAVAFRKFAKVGATFAKFSADEELAIRLNHMLCLKGAPLDTARGVNEVIFRHTGVLQPLEDIGECQAYISRDRLLNRLAVRYNRYPRALVEEAVARKKQGLRKTTFPEYFEKKSILLPASGGRVDVLLYPFKEQLVRLLTDPRLEDTHWDHFNNDPLAPPPREWQVLGNLTTGRAYRASYEKYVTRKGKQLLLGFIAYIDETTTGQFTDLGFQPVKISLANLTEEVSSSHFVSMVLHFNCHLTHVFVCN